MNSDISAVEIENTPNGLDSSLGELAEAFSDQEMACVRCVHGAAVAAYDASADGRLWTRLIKDALLQVGKSLGYLVCPDPDVPFGEWLFDVIWAKRDSRLPPDRHTWRNVQGLALACECEWQDLEGFVLEDFMKLTFAKADLKLFIYTNNRPVATHDGHRMEPAELIRASCPMGDEDRYLALGFSSNRERHCRVDAWGGRS